MNRLEKFLAWAHPMLLISGSKWESNWLNQEQKSFVLLARIIFPLISIVYILHYYFYDIPMGLEPTERWMKFRYSVASVSILTFFYYLFFTVGPKYFRLPAVFTLWLVCVAQGLAMVWYGQETWVFGFILVASFAIILKMSPLGSILFCFVAIGSLIPFYVFAGLDLPDIATGSMVTISIALLARSSSLSDVENFLLTQENADAQARIAELRGELADRMRAFVPKEIASRVDSNLSIERRSVIDAYIEVMRPMKKEVACIFSDIRGYTKSAEELDDFIGASVFPELKACSNAVENHHGVPRKVGDLIFAYFDCPEPDLNTKRALSAAFEISRINRDFNQTASTKQIKRYILVSSGHAIVGNIGGFDSSIEITALGPPVNYLSRLDEASKVERLASRLQTGDIILSHDFFMKCSTNLKVEWELIDLQEIGIVIRDFPKERYVVRLPFSDESFEVMRQL
jgi:class 3 adenylate cyclase